jgi:hypothetical protein
VNEVVREIEFLPVEKQGKFVYVSNGESSFVKCETSMNCYHKNGEGEKLVILKEKSPRKDLALKPNHILKHLKIYLNHLFNFNTIFKNPFINLAYLKLKMHNVHYTNRKLFTFIYHNCIIYTE